MTAGNGVVRRAAALCVPGATFTPSESATVRAGAAAAVERFATTEAYRLTIARLAGGEPLGPEDKLALIELEDSDLSPLERRVFTQALKLAHYGPSRPEQTLDPQVAARLAELVASRGAADALAGVALEKLAAAGLKVNRTKPETDAYHQARAEHDAAVAAYHGARDAADHSASTLAAYQNGLANRARAAALAAHVKA